MNPAPIRVHRQRTKGWRKPPHTKFVNRPSMFGNPYHVVGSNADGWRVLLLREVPAGGPYPTRREAAEEAVRLYVARLRPRHIRAIKRVLRGWNLGCFCGLDLPCHVDVLLEIANAPACEEVT